MSREKVVKIQDKIKIFGCIRQAFHFEIAQRVATVDSKGPFGLDVCLGSEVGGLQNIITIEKRVDRMKGSGRRNRVRVYDLKLKFSGLFSVSTDTFSMVPVQ